MNVANEAYDVFISYSRVDARHAAEIDSILRAKGLRSFFDRRNLAPGLPWVRALEQAISAAKAAIVLIGPRGLGNTQQYERELALVRQTHDPTFPVVPVILPGPSTDRPFDFLQLLTWIDFSQVTKVSDAPDEVEHLLTAIRGGPISSDVVQEVICPYRGLDAFREEDSAFFFGRGSADDPKSRIGELVSKVREHPFAMVVGRSGSGKSSLIYAGLLPALRREHDLFWNVLSLRPGPNPLRALAAAFNPRADGEGAAEYADKITKEADRLRTGALELLSHMIREELDRSEGKPDRLLLYIDQWEELYAQAPSSSDTERAAQHAVDVHRFIDLLLTAARTAPVAVVGTVRAGFYGPLIGHQEIRALLPTRQVLLGSMSRSELESTIVEPAKKVGLAFDPPGLVQHIVDEVGEDERTLPLLQYALKESWALRKGTTITADSYARSGGVREAIRITAERTFNALSADEQLAARQLFLSLVTPGEGQEDTRARAAMPSDAIRRRIVDEFAGPRTRLLVTGADRAARPTVEVAHEALIRTWPRLRGWIDANREKLRARVAVLQAKAEWEQQGRRDDLLLPPGFQLERARALLAEPGDLKIDDIQEFIALSSGREETERKEREQARVRDKARVAEIRASQRRFARLKRRALAAVGVATLSAVVTVSYLLYRQQIETFKSREEGLQATYTFLGRLPGLLNDGSIKVVAAEIFINDLSRQFSKVHDRSPDLAKIEISLLHAVSDVKDALGDYKSASDLVTKAEALSEDFLKRYPDSPEFKELLYASKFRVGDQLTRTSLNKDNVEKAEHEYREAADLAKQLALSEPNNPQRQRDLIFILNKFGDLAQARQDWRGALEKYEEGMRIAQSIADAHPVDLAIEKSRIAGVLSTRNQPGDKQAALDGYRQALKIQTQQSAGNPKNSTLISNVALTHRRIGDLLKDRPDEAQQEFEAAVKGRTALYRSDPGNVDWCVDLVTDQIRLGDVLMTKGDRRGALRSYTEAAKIAEEIITKDPTSTIWQRRFAELTVKRGDLLVTRSNEVINESPQDQSSRIIEMALEAYRNSEHAYEDLLRLSKPPYRELFDVRTKIGDVLVRQNKYPETLKAYRLASQVAQQAAATQRVVDWQIELSNALELTGDLLVLRERDNTEHAKTFYQEALAVLESTASKEPDNQDLQSRRASLKDKINSR